MGKTLLQTLLSQMKDANAKSEPTWFCHTVKTVLRQSHPGLVPHSFIVVTNKLVRFYYGEGSEAK